MAKSSEHSLAVQVFWSLSPSQCPAQNWKFSCQLWVLWHHLSLVFHPHRNNISTWLLTQVASNKPLLAGSVSSIHSCGFMMMWNSWLYVPMCLGYWWTCNTFHNQSARTMNLCFVDSTKLRVRLQVPEPMIMELLCGEALNIVLPGSYLFLELSCPCTHSREVDMQQSWNIRVLKVWPS